MAALGIVDITPQIRQQVRQLAIGPTEGTTAFGSAFLASVTSGSLRASRSNRADSTLGTLWVLPVQQRHQPPDVHPPHGHPGDRVVQPCLAVRRVPVRHPDPVVPAALSRLRVATPFSTFIDDEPASNGHRGIDGSDDRAYLISQVRCRHFSQGIRGLSGAPLSTESSMYALL